MLNQKIKILVVDDSAFMRKAITRIIHTDESFKVVSVASNGMEALDMISQYNPDVITLDVEMPKMNGLEALKKIQNRYSIPVIMVSSITRSGSEMAIRCLEEGAFDFVCKPESYVSMNISKISNDLILKLKSAAHVKIKKESRFLPPRPIVKPVQSNDIRSRLPKKYNRTHIPAQRIITIGSSTGGPRALQTILSQLPKDIPAGIVVVQHMPPGNFIHSLSDRLDTYSSLNVRLAKDGDVVENGVALVGPIGKHVVFERQGETYKIRLRKFPQDTLHCPSIDILFQSAGDVIGAHNISCILTGMGSDGTQGLSTVYNEGGYVIAESEESCIVYGMPRSAVEAGYVNEISPINKISGLLVNLLSDSYTIA